ncbi:tyrosine-type recombinase/integrase [Arthrobacter sp. Z4-13]
MASGLGALAPRRRFRKKARLQRPGAAEPFTKRTGKITGCQPSRLLKARGLTKTPRIHDLRHTHACWLLREGVISLFAISSRLGHASVRTTEQEFHQFT